MSECVVRMEMPLNCFECPMYDWNRQKLCCNAHLDLRPIPNGGVPKPDWCPIICQLPEGHGRMVDADELKAKQQEDADLFINAYTLMEKSRRDEALNAVANIVNATTIVPAEAERSET